MGIGLTLKNFNFKKSTLDLGINGCYALFSFQYPIIIYLVPFPYLQIRIIPSVNLNACFQIGFQFNFEKKNYLFYIDISLQSEASASVELGLYFPPFSVGFKISFSIGLKGILGSGTVGLKLSIFLGNSNSKYKLEMYYQFKTLQLYAYILFKIEFNLGIIKFDFKFYLYNEKILGCKKCQTKGNKTLSEL